MQFLLNPDGSIPAGTNISALIALGVRLVRPAPVPSPAPDMQIVEGEPEEINGIWWQTWAQVPASPSQAALPDITRWQFARFLATPPLRGVLAVAEPIAEDADPDVFADFQGFKQLDLHSFEGAVSMILRFSPFFPTNSNINAETLAPIWLEAAAF